MKPNRAKARGHTPNGVTLFIQFRGILGCPDFYGFALDPSAKGIAEPDLLELVERYTKIVAEGKASRCAGCPTSPMTAIGRISTIARGPESMSGLICPACVPREREALMHFGRHVIPEILASELLSTRKPTRH